MDSEYVERASFTIEPAPFGFKGGCKAWMEHCRNVAAVRLQEAGLRHVASPVKIVARFFVKPSRHDSDLIT